MRNLDTIKSFTPLSHEELRELWLLVNPAYSDQPGTESYERKRLVLSAIWWEAIEDGSRHKYICKDCSLSNDNAYWFRAKLAEIGISLEGEDG